MKLAIITDTHQGARSGSSIFREYFRWWYEEQFFSVLRLAEIDTVLHLGDFFDNRNAITLQDIDFVTQWFASKLKEYGLKMYITLGNHDVAFKNTNKIHSLSMLQAAAPDNVIIIEDPTLVQFGSTPFVLVPWVNAENYDKTFELLANVPNKNKTIVGGHWEISGAKHYAKSAPAEHGLDPDVFKEFKEVWSGHFHHKSKMSNVRYMGSSFHLNWQDYGDDRGFHIFNTETDQLDFYKNEYCLFVEVAFDASIFKGLTDEQCEDMFQGRFVRLVVDEDYDKAILLDTIAKINRSKPHDLQVINNTLLKKPSDDNDTVAEVDVTKSTQEYILGYIESRQDYNTQKVKDKMTELFTSAQQAMVKGE